MKTFKRTTSGQSPRGSSFFGDDEDACVAAFWGGAVAQAYQKFDEQTKQEAHKEYLESIQKFNNGKGYHIPGEFVIVQGRK